MTLYHELDPWLCLWLQNLMEEGGVSPGRVVQGDIREGLPAGDFTRVHLCAGVGGWDEALDLAGWGRDRPVWTVSCPCQPFSRVGLRQGDSDARHLWPYIHRLIDRDRPPVVFGEQVASSDGDAWLDGVWSDMEASGYIFEAADLSAAGLGAPHIRQRLYWVGYTERERLEGYCGNGCSIWDPSQVRPDTSPSLLRTWDRYESLACVDGNRRIQPGTFPVVNGTTNRVGRLRAYGNALVPQVASLFVRSFMES